MLVRQVHKPASPVPQRFLGVFKIPWTAENDVSVARPGVAQTSVVVVGGRLTDWISLGVLASFVPRDGLTRIA
jgi:hypothetical protein